MPPDEKEGFVNPGAPMTLGGPGRLDLPENKTSDPSSFLNPMPGVPIMAAPPAGAFRQAPPKIGNYRSGLGENRAEYERDRMNFQNRGAYGELFTGKGKAAWNGVDIQRLNMAVKAGKSVKEITDIFPGRTEKAVGEQIRRLYGGVRKFKKTNPRYPLLRDDEFSALHPEVRSLIEPTQLAGDVVGFPKTTRERDYNILKQEFQDAPLKPGSDPFAVTPFNPSGDMTGGGKVLPGPGYTSSLDHEDDVG